MTQAKTKRGVLRSDRLTYGEASMLLVGFDWFNDIKDPSILKAKWEMYREVLMKLWNSHKPFSIGDFECTENKPGTFPWAYTEYDK